MPKQLRDYQEITLHKMNKYLHEKGGKSGIVHLATGLGKTIVTTHFVDRYANPRNGKRTLVIGGQNNTLTYQFYDAFIADFPWMAGVVGWQGKAVKCLGIVMNAHNDVGARVVIASIQTLMSTHELSAARKPPEMEPIEKSDFKVSKIGTIHINPKSKRRWLVSPRMDELLAVGGLFQYYIHDECHLSLADGSVLLIQRLQELHTLLDLEPMKIIGNTATPARADNRGLHTLYETIFVSYPYQYGQRHGYLVPFAPPLRILVDTVEKDTNGNHSAELTTKSTVRYTENWDEVLAKGWLEKGEGRPTFCYVSDHDGGSSHVEASIKLTRTMQSMGIRAAHVDGTGCIGPDGDELDKREQRRLLKMMATGQLDVLCNYGVLTTGIDCPPVSCVLNARRISGDNPVLLTQIIGRVLRPHEASGKKNALIIDSTGEPIVLNGIAELSGFKVDPGSGKYVEDFDIEMVFNEIVRLCNERYEEVMRWRMTQKRYSLSTLDEAFDLAFKLDKDNVLSTHLRALSDCIEYLQDEDKLMEGLDSRDLRVGSNIHGINQSYDIIKITSKSKAAWFVDDLSALMSLSVSPGISFVLHPPNHTRARVAKEALELIKSNEPNFLTQGKSPEQLETIRKFMEKSLELFENFTLWAVDCSKPWDTKIQTKFGDFWVAADEGLDSLEDHAFGFAQENIESYAKNFAEKKNRRSWAKEEPTSAQVKMLSNLLEGKLPKDAQRSFADGGWSKGDMSDNINHIASVRPVEATVKNFEDRIDKIKEML